MVERSVKPGIHQPLKQILKCICVCAPGWSSFLGLVKSHSVDFHSGDISFRSSRGEYCNWKALRPYSVSAFPPWKLCAPTSSLLLNLFSAATSSSSLSSTSWLNKVSLSPYITPSKERGRCVNKSCIQVNLLPAWIWLHFTLFNTHWLSMCKYCVCKKTRWLNKLYI